MPLVSETLSPSRGDAEPQWGDSESRWARGTSDSGLKALTPAWPTRVNELRDLLIPQSWS